MICIFALAGEHFPINTIVSATGRSCTRITNPVKPLVEAFYLPPTPSSPNIRSAQSADTTLRT
ncbi:hypothetical protein C0Q70_07046 [Pomacea canaliculata]|uniref:Uncharacterized protein n=1 Tax=Pomacea canaliculata TaxID=400727 RepID=A0A2T7PDY6_POMCA|nr:hypothetical protein C0Q70_07046 [Pomacea canaliculata]